jgi:hypothetical protein
VTGTTSIAAKTALITALQALTSTTLAGVQVAYTYPAALQRECVWGGSISGPMELVAMRGSGRIKRLETPTLELHISVVTPGQPDTVAAETRAAAIGAAVEEHLAANPTLGVPGLLSAAVIGIEIDSGVDDDGAEALLTYQIKLMAHLT